MRAVDDAHRAGASRPGHGVPRSERGLVLVAVVIAAATLVVTVTLGLVLISAKEGNLTLGGQFWQVVAAVVVAMAM